MKNLNSSKTLLKGTAVLIGMCIAALLSSCANVPVSQQALLSKSSMQVANSGTVSSLYVSRVSSNIEPGISDGGSVATSCSSCK